MGRCPKCNIIIYNRSGVCPLCNCVTDELTGEDEKAAALKFGENAPYPNVLGRAKLVKLILRIVLFVFVVAEVIMVLINYYTPIRYPWSLITGICMLYIYLFLLYWISHDSGFASKIGLQMLITMIALFFIDKANGMRGWSLQWAIPGIILLGDGIVFFVMMLNRSRWQSYVLLLILLGLCSAAIIILYVFGLIHSAVMPFICFLVTLFYIFGTFLFGGKKAGNELSRRFHI